MSVSRVCNMSVLSEKKQKIFSEGVPVFCVSMSV
jgi:hypothetical protein